MQWFLTFLQPHLLKHSSTASHCHQPLSGQQCISANCVSPSLMTDTPSETHFLNPLDFPITQSNSTLVPGTGSSSPEDPSLGCTSWSHSGTPPLVLNFFFFFNISLKYNLQLFVISKGFSGDSDGKESACSAGDGFEPWVRKIPWRREWLPTPVFLPGKSHGQRSLVGYSPWGHKESDTTTTDQLTLFKLLVLILLFLSYVQRPYCHFCIFMNVSWPKVCSASDWFWGSAFQC